MEIITIGRTKKPAKSFPSHEHGYWEIIYNDHGTGVMTIDQMKLPFGPGDIVILPPNIPHSKVSEEGFTDICIMIKDMRPIGYAKPLILKDDDTQSIYQLMIMIDHVDKHPDLYGEKHIGPIRNAIGETIFQLLSGLFDAGFKRELHVESAIRDMENNISNCDYNLDTYIAQIGYSKGHFRRVFKTETGEPPLQYFNHMRIQHAKNLILQYGPSRSLKDIALASGFSDPYYFSRLFKKITGMSPSDFVAQRGTFDMDQVDGARLRPDLHE